MSGGFDVFGGDFNFDIGENLKLVINGFIIIFQSVEVGVTKKNSLELVIGSFKISERGSEGEEVVVGLEISFFERGFEEVWAVTLSGCEILFDGFEIGVVS